MKTFYRYEAVEYGTIGYDGEYVESIYPCPKVVLREYDLLKETPKGYWISAGKWVSKKGRKRFAYPTQKEAIINFIKRNESRVKILSRQVHSCETQIELASFMLKSM